MKYRYLGSTEVQIHGIGLVQADQIVETDQEITHPHFQLVKDTKPLKEEKE